MRTLEEVNSEILNLKMELKDIKGTETEVYTRIVGYHRAVSNWNKGKKEEYFNRVTFKFDDEKINEMNLFLNNYNQEGVVEIKPQKETVNISSQVAFYKLFYSQYCHNCPPVKDFLKKINIPGEEIDVSLDLGLNISREYNIMSTPTVILFDGNENIIDTVNCLEDLEKLIFKK